MLTVKDGIVIIDIFHNEKPVELAYRDFMFYCIMALGTSTPTDNELVRDFAFRTGISLRDGILYSQEHLQEVYTNMIQQVRQNFLDTKDLS